jgi:Zn finger protein HypA/HybF involved in hydrogenase expression
MFASPNKSFAAAKSKVGKIWVDVGELVRMKRSPAQQGAECPSKTAVRSAAVVAKRIPSVMQCNSFALFSF